MCNIALFEFKVDMCGILRFGTINVMRDTLSSVRSFECIVNEDALENEDTDTFEEIYNFVFDFLNEKIWIGHGIMESDVPRLKRAFDKIGKAYPKATSIIDTQVLLSGIKLGKIAPHFGLGQQGGRTVMDLFSPRCIEKACLANVKAIKNCVDLLNLYEPDKIKNYVGRDSHPMICYLMDLKAAADTTAHLSELDIES